MKTFTIILTLFYFQLSSGQDLPGHYVKARAAMVQDATETAIIFFNKAIEENPSNIEAYYQRGMCYYMLKNYDNAIADFLNVNRRYFGKASLMLARIECKLNHKELAVKYLREHLSSSYKLPEKDILLDNDLAPLESTSAYKALWKEKEWYGTYDKELQESVYLKSNGELLQSINLLNKLEKKGFKRSLVNQYLAEIYLQSGNEKAALDAINKSINSDSRNIEALKLRITLLESDGQLESALSDCNRLLRIAPDEFEYYLIAAKIENQAGSYENALKKINFYLDLFPKSLVAQNELGEIEYDNGKFIKALSIFNMILEQDKSNPLYYYNRGICYSRTKTYKYAVKDFSMALDLDPQNADIWYQKGLADIELGFNERACFDFTRALQHGKFEAREYINKLCKN